MAHFVTLVVPESIESCPENQPPFTFTSSLLQLCSRQDCQPVHKYNEKAVALLVGDGHGGHKCASIIDENSEKILTEILTNGAESAMAMADNVCSSARDGAMLTLLHYDLETRIITIVSRGDCSCVVHQNGDILHEQCHHSYAVVESNAILLKQAEDMGIHLYTTFRPNGPILTPDPDGITMDVKFAPTYFRWDNDCTVVQSASFVGHSKIARLPAFVSVVEVPLGPFRICMTSDGVSDVVHPADAIMVSSTAEVIAEEAYTRWCTPFFSESFDPRLSDNNENGHLVINPRQTTVSTTNDGTILRTNKGGDDISVAVLDVHK